MRFNASAQVAQAPRLLPPTVAEPMPAPAKNERTGEPLLKLVLCATLSVVILAAGLQFGA